MTGIKERLQELKSERERLFDTIDEILENIDEIDKHIEKIITLAMEILIPIVDDQE